MDSIVPAQQVDVLVVAAYGPDLRGLRSAIGERFVGHVRNLYVCGKTVGVGLGVAGASTAKRAFQLAPRAIVHLGTCGIYPGGLDYRPTDVLVADTVHLADLGVLTRRSKFPEPMQTQLSSSSMLAAGLHGSGGARCFRAPIASCLSATQDEQLGSEIRARVGAHAENLEAFAVARACHLAEIPFVSVLSATHITGKGSGDHKSKFDRPATLAAAEVLLSWLSNGAQGMPHG